MLILPDLSCNLEFGIYFTLQLWLCFSSFYLYYDSISYHITVEADFSKYGIIQIPFKYTHDNLSCSCWSVLPSSLFSFKSTSKMFCTYVIRLSFNFLLHVLIQLETILSYFSKHHGKSWCTFNYFCTILRCFTYLLNKAPHWNGQWYFLLNHCYFFKGVVSRFFSTSCDDERYHVKNKVFILIISISWLLWRVSS